MVAQAADLGSAVVGPLHQAQPAGRDEPPAARREGDTPHRALAHETAQLADLPAGRVHRHGPEDSARVLGADPEAPHLDHLAPALDLQRVLAGLHLEALLEFLPVYL
ncbi:MAG TPA: hypothetical protein VG013_25110, partial [Gemmataceae bacterium]|nr:hypothetical protein [Gemmataceae bacterium]